MPKTAADNLLRKSVTFKTPHTISKGRPSASDRSSPESFTQISTCDPEPSQQTQEQNRTPHMSLLKLQSQSTFASIDDCVAAGGSVDRFGMVDVNFN